MANLELKFSLIITSLKGMKVRLTFILKANKNNPEQNNPEHPFEFECSSSSSSSSFRDGLKIFWTSTGTPGEGTECGITAF